MPYLVFDTETTGLPLWNAPADAPGQPRLASIAMLAVDDDLEIEQRFEALVLPTDWEMPAEASRINGLTQERLLAEGMPICYILNTFKHAMIGRTLVAHNLQFDSKIMRGEQRRAAFADDCRDGICTMRALTEACALPKPSGPGLKFPRLVDACRILLNRPLPGAHNAMVDAKACLWLLRVMSERGILQRLQERQESIVVGVA